MVVVRLVCGGVGVGVGGVVVGGGRVVGGGVGVGCRDSVVIVGVDGVATVFVNAVVGYVVGVDVCDGVVVVWCRR